MCREQIGGIRKQAVMAMNSAAARSLHLSINLNSAVCEEERLRLVLCHVIDTQ